MRDSHQMYPTITIVFGHLPRAPGQMSFLLKHASANLRVFLYIFFNNHKRVQVPFQNPNLKAKLVIPRSTWALLGL